MTPDPTRGRRLRWPASWLWPAAGVAGTERPPRRRRRRSGTRRSPPTEVDELADRATATAVEEQIRTEGSRCRCASSSAGDRRPARARRSAAEQLAEEYGVEPGDAVPHAGRRDREPRPQDLDEDVADAYVEVNSISPYVVDVLPRPSERSSWSGAARADPASTSSRPPALAALDAWLDARRASRSTRATAWRSSDGSVPVPVDTDVSFARRRTSATGRAAAASRTPRTPRTRRRTSTRCGQPSDRPAAADRRPGEPLARVRSR